MKNRYKYNENKKVFAFYMILHAMVVLTGIRCFLTQNYENVLVCILALILFLAPAFIEERMDISIPPLFQIIIFFFIFAAEILGEVNHYYVKIPGWDTMLHTMNGFLCVAVGFSLVYLLNRGSKNVNLSPFLPDARCFLLLHDDRCFMGVFRIRHGSDFLSGYAEGLYCDRVWVCNT